MNGLTVNLHLMLISFYCPVGERRLILMEEPTFPSDRYAVQSQLRLHGLDPSEALLTIKARPGEQLIRSEDIGALLEARGQEIAVILLSGVNFFTGQLFDIERITAAAHRQGCIVGWDLAHAVGNVPLRLHDWQVDFAVWCSYKYLNAGPGAVAGCFIHARHVQRLDLPRLAGWWGHDPATRFRMQLEPTWNPSPSADSWQLSNPPILALAPLRASLDLFDEATMPALRERSEHLTSYLEFLLDGIPGSRYEIMSPREPAQRGCQLSVLVRDKPREVLTALVKAGIVCDFREPNIIRVAPVPLYNSFEDVWRFAQALTGV